MKSLTLLLFIAFIQHSLISTGQSEHTDTSFMEQAYEQYWERRNDKYNGREYIPFGERIYMDHSFFASDKFTGGTIVYDNVLYKDVLLKYDLIQHQLIILYSDGENEVVLSPEKVQWFKIGQHTFLPVGKKFYELLYSGKKLQVLAFDAKKPFGKTENGNTGLYTTLKVTRSYVISVEDKLYTIKKQKDLLNLFQRQREEIIRHIRDSNIDWEMDTEKAIISIVSYCNH